KTCSYNGDSWKTGNCTTATCENGTITEKTVDCKKVTIPACENTYSPVKVYDEAGCCFHYECRCVCSGWGDPHYLTFDGTYYSFQENCTYVLVKEIIPRHNFTVHIDNENCDASGTVTCVHALIVYYKNYKVRLIQEVTPKTENKVYINGKQVFPTFSNDDFTITSTQIELILKIPEIKATVTFKGLQFSVDVPYSLFHNNTEGQCGTCDNNKKNDCRLPNGQIHHSCAEMAHDWHVRDENKTYCERPTPSPPGPTSSPITTISPPTPCIPAICDIITSKVFEECNKKIKPEHYYEACKFDVCHMPNTTMGCSSLAAYASKCDDAGICVNWRNSTDGQCEYVCPENKVYKPCATTVSPICNERYVQSEQNTPSQSFKEGCFCPDGMFQFSTDSDLCVHSCCIGPDGTPRKIGSKWQSDCNWCVCDEVKREVKCKPITCPTQEPITCDKEGEVLETYTEDCCERAKCSEVFYIFEVHQWDGFYILLQPGVDVPKDPCQNCNCGNTKDNITKLNLIVCTPKPCSTDCPQGYEYKISPGQCCGKCVETSCVVVLPDNTTHIIEVSSSWSPPNDNCTTYDCKMVNGKPKITELVVECPDYDPQNCFPVSIYGT
uniref:VWFD domain-containing protein n=1 Tax=Myripristis murdjan TaxID=586833 RepID=A0A667ZMP2_9TELE